MWEARSGKLLTTLKGRKNPLYRAKFSPDGLRIVAEANDARVWDAQSGELLATLAGDEDWVWSAQYSPDNRRIVTASHDKLARVYTILPPGAGPPPKWFPDFLRYLVQMRLNSDGEIETLKPEAWLTLRERLREVQRASVGQDTTYLRVLRHWVTE